MEVARKEKEFEKSSETLEKEATLLRARHGGIQNTKMEKEEEKEKQIEKRLFKKPRSEPEKEKEPEKKEKEKQEENPVLAAARKRNIKQSREQMMEHDMREQALGRMVGVPGANIDYDEIKKMAKNNIRDSDELYHESLENDGIPDKESYEKAKSAIEAYAKTERKEPELLKKVIKIEEKADTDTFTRAFMDVLKESGKKEMSRMDEVFDACRMERPCYENAIDRICDSDRKADRAMERFEMEIGRERSLID